MRLNRKWSEAEVRSVARQLRQEYPSVPSDVTALVVQVAKLNLSPEEEPATLLAEARRLLGRSVLMHALQDSSGSPNLALAS
jgi:hypothetical protein